MLSSTPSTLIFLIFSNYFSLSILFQFLKNTKYSSKFKIKIFVINFHSIFETDSIAIMIDLHIFVNFFVLFSKIPKITIFNKIRQNKYWKLHTVSLTCAHTNQNVHNILNSDISIYCVSQANRQCEFLILVFVCHLKDQKLFADRHTKYWCTTKEYKLQSWSTPNRPGSQLTDKWQLIVLVLFFIYNFLWTF